MWCGSGGGVFEDEVMTDKVMVHAWRTRYSQRCLHTKANCNYADDHVYRLYSVPVTSNIWRGYMRHDNIEVRDYLCPECRLELAEYLLREPEED